MNISAYIGFRNIGTVILAGQANRYDEGPLVFAKLVFRFTSTLLRMIALRGYSNAITSAKCIGHRYANRR
jgi:hypothetical protein